MSDIKSGDTVFVVSSCVGPSFDPVAYVHETVVDSVIPGYGIVRKIGDSQFPEKSVNVFATKSDASLAAVSRLRAALERITESYEKRIAEMESHCRA